jgi:hypothetical protein
MVIRWWYDGLEVAMIFDFGFGFDDVAMCDVVCAAMKTAMQVAMQDACDASGAMQVAMQCKLDR